MNAFDRIARANPDYVETLYQQFRRDPDSVDPEWALVFAGYQFGQSRDTSGEAGAAAPVTGVFDLIHSYRELGHLIAELDPLGHSPWTHPLLRLEEFGFREDDLEATVHCGSFRGFSQAKLSELVEALKDTYCRTLGVEYLDIDDKEKREFLQERMEPCRNRADMTDEHRLQVLHQLVTTEGFERYLHTKFTGQKRFSLEGGEALIPLLDTLVEDAGNHDVKEIVMGMPHRGRLNVLAHTLKKPYEMIFAEFDGSFLPSDVTGDGDVKYHLGYSRDAVTRDGQKIHLSLSYNPSHLEAINPVVEGIVRAKQHNLNDSERRRVVPILLHGDAAFTGQGLVMETLALGELDGFSTGGTIHIVVNNQVGFTTSPDEYRRSRYPTDLAMVTQSPVFHVNGDDPEAAVHAARVAMEYRQTFRTDVFIDLVCYRRHGHNELDDPTFTQPVMYEQIRKHPTVTEHYARRLKDAGVIDDEGLEKMVADHRATMDDALEYTRQFKPRQEVFALGGVWSGFDWAGDDWSSRTRVEAPKLRQIADALPQVPEDFNPHKRVLKVLESRRDMVSAGEGIDWGCAETLAYGSLLLEGTPIRLTGQDVGRGTFSHRHAVLCDAKFGDRHIPLNHMANGQAEIEIVNSLLSEAGVLGFEYGMSSADPRRLVIWEAQFGDFANGAQVIIDQFIASAESKWQRMSGLVMLLPHGYEGQGPEHSSARLERFLQLSAEKNWQVVNCTTPAQLFHVLRRQIHRSFRKPLIVMSPKSLLRHPACVSKIAELSSRDFESVLADPRNPEPANTSRVLLCSGRVFYSLDQARQDRSIDNVAILRLEQLYPFPKEELTAALERYDDAVELVWVQEEPQNQGSWFFVRPFIDEMLPGQRLSYVGLDAAASPATGSYKLHQAEEEAFIAEALGTTPGGSEKSQPEARASA